MINSGRCGTSQSGSNKCPFATNRTPINRDNDDMQYEALEACQSKYNKDSDI